jgi:hypothetical protein
MSEWWSPQRKLNLDGIFSHEEEGESTVEKSNRWTQQREADGTPHTRGGPSALVPPAAGPKLYLEDFEKANKAIAADDDPTKQPVSNLDAEKVVKAYFVLSQDMVAKGLGEVVKAASKSISEDPSLADGADRKKPGQLEKIAPVIATTVNKTEVDDDKDKMGKDTAKKIVPPLE